MNYAHPTRMCASRIALNANCSGSMITAGKIARRAKSTQPRAPGHANKN